MWLPTLTAFPANVTGNIVHSTKLNPFTCQTNGYTISLFISNYILHYNCVSLPTYHFVTIFFEAFTSKCTNCSRETKHLWVDPCRSDCNCFSRMFVRCFVNDLLDDALNEKTICTFLFIASRVHLLIYGPCPFVCCKSKKVWWFSGESTDI